MTTLEKTGIARRPILKSVTALLGLGVAGGLIFEVPRLFGRRYPRTKFDDLLDQVPDRESAARLGQAAIAQIERHKDVWPLPGAASAASDLRSGPGNGSIASAVQADIAKGRLVELQGWILPLSLVLVSVIAAEVQPAAPGSA